MYVSHVRICWYISKTGKVCAYLLWAHQSDTLSRCDVPLLPPCPRLHFRAIAIRRSLLARSPTPRGTRQRMTLIQLEIKTHQSITD